MVPGSSASSPATTSLISLSISRTCCGANASLCCSRSWRPRREVAMSETMSEKEIPETWVGQRVRVGHAHSVSTHTDGLLLGVGDRGIVVEGGELVRFYPWTSVGSIEKTHEEGGENPGVQAGGPGSNRLAAIDGLREEAAGTCSTRLGVEVCGPRRPRRVHRRSKGLRRLLARTRHLRAVVARSRVGRFQRPDGPRRRAVRRPLSKPG